MAVAWEESMVANGSSPKMTGLGRERTRAERRHLGIIAGIFVAIMCVGALLWSSWDVLRYITQRDSADAASSTDTRSAKVVYDVAGKCRQIAFDNDTGEIAGNGKPCNPAVAEGATTVGNKGVASAGNGNATTAGNNGVLSAGSNGVPEPLGTVRRLEAISKAFNR
jgi:hypothetical protein